MEDKLTDKEYELKAQKRDLELQLDELEDRKRKVWQRESDEDFGLTISDRRLEEMKLCCDPNDQKLLNLMEEKQQIMHGIRSKKDEFATEFEFEMKRKQQQLEQELEDVQMQLTSIWNQEEDMLSQSDWEKENGDYIYD